MTAPRTETFRTLASLSRVELLHLLQERGQRTLAELVEATGLHPNTVREHLQRLTRGGYVTSTVETRTTRGRPRTLYSAVTGADDTTDEGIARKVAAATLRADQMRRYLAASDTAEAPDAAGPDGRQSLSAGARHQIDALDDHLDQSGFDACIDATALRVDITDCPYQDMVAASHGAVCVVHLGLVRTLLTQIGGPITARELLPFSAPGCCTLTLDDGAGAEPGTGTDA